MGLLWVLNLSDGRHSLLDIAERAKMPFAIIRRAADALHDASLLAILDRDPPSRALVDSPSATGLSRPLLRSRRRNR
jgi:hypothetical protein